MSSVLSSHKPMPTQSNIVLAIAIGLMAMVFWLDLQTPLGVAGGVPYVAVVLLTLWLPSSTTTVVFATLCTGFTLLGFWWSPPGGEFWKVVTNRTLALFVIWATSLLTLVHKKHLAKINTEGLAFRTMMDLVPHLVFARNTEGRILTANQAARTFMGMTQKELQENGRYALYPSSGEECMGRRRDDAQLKSEPCLTAFVEAYRDAQGSVRVFNVNKFPFLWPETAEQVLVTVAVDETEQLEQLEKLKMTERVIDSSSDHISIVGRDYRYRRVNPAYEQAHGIAQQDIVGLHIQELLGFEVFHGVVKPQFDQCLKGQDIHYEDWFTFGHGGRRYQAVSYTPLRDENGNIDGVVVISRDLTERQLADEGVAYQASLLNAVIDGSPDSIFVKDLTGKYLMINPAGGRLINRQENQVVGNKDADLFGEEVAEYFSQIDQQVMNSGMPLTVEDTFLVEGESKIFSTMKAPIRNSRGNLSGLIWVARDITHLKKTEEALLKSKERFRDLYESAPLAYFSATPEGRIMTVNSRALDLLGYSKEELVGRAVVDLYAPTESGRTKALGVQEQLLSGQEILDQELQMQRADGCIVWVSLTVRLIYDEQGNLLERRGMVQDITQRKQAQEELLKSEYRYRSLIETAGSVIVGLDCHGCITEWNREAEIVYGKTREAVLGENYGEMFLKEEDRSAVAADIQKVLSGEPTRDFENAVRSAGGHDRIFMWNVDRLLDPHHIPIGLIAIGRDITERKHAEEALRESEERFAMALEATGSGSWDWHIPSGTVVYGDNWIKLLGYEKSQVPDQVSFWEEIVHPEDMPHVQEALERHFNGETEYYECMNRLRTASGDWKWSLDRGKVVEWDPDQRPVRMVGTDTDITQKKEAEEILQKRTIEIHDLYNHAPCGYHSLDENGRFLEVNDTELVWLGYTCEELLNGTRASDILTAASQQVFGEIFPIFKKRGWLKNIQLDFVRKDGTIMPALVSASAIYDANGRFIQSRSSVLDISDLKQTESALRESEERFRQFADNTEDVIWLTDLQNHQILYINPAYEKLWGCSAQELYRDPLAWVNLIHPDDRPQVVESFTNVVNTGQFDKEYRLLRADGSIRWIRDRGFLIRDPEGQPYRIGGYAQDITDRKVLEDAIRRQNEELEEEVKRRTARIKELEQRRMQMEKLAALAQVAAGVAHEINNPLASIGQSLEILKRAIPISNPRYKYTGKIQDSVDRISRIVKQLYLLYGPEIGQPRSIDIVATVLSAVEIMKKQAKTAEVQLVSHMPRETIAAKVPRSDLIQVLCNLIQNALDVSSPGNQVKIDLECNTERLLLSVCDHGEGIPSDVAPHVFEPFFTTKQSSSSGAGMGLGLAVSYRLVESMGGILDFTTEIGHGSVFTVTLPKVQRQEPTRRQAT